MAGWINRKQQHTIGRGPQTRLHRSCNQSGARLSPCVALCAGKEQPIGLLLVDQAVVIGDRLDADLFKDRAKCISER